MESIHGHHVLKLMKSLNGNVTVESLLAAMSTTFGLDAKYHTCSAQGMDGLQLLESFLAKGKFEVVDGELIHRGCQCGCKH